MSNPMDVDAIAVINSFPAVFKTRIWLACEHMNVEMLRQSFTQFREQLPGRFVVRPIRAIDKQDSHESFFSIGWRWFSFS